MLEHLAVSQDKRSRRVQWAHPDSTAATLEHTPDPGLAAQQVGVTVMIQVAG